MRILVALDGSPSAVQARDLVAGLPWPPSTTIRLIAAYEPSVDWLGASAGVALSDGGDALRNELRAELEALAEPLLRKGWAIEQSVIGGRPATTIVDEAREMRADLIVVGSRGRGPLASMLLGSVSAEVVEEAPCAVLVARASHISKVLLATDGSDAVLAIPNHLRAWHIFSGLDALTLSVAPAPESDYELIATSYTMGIHRLDGRRQDALDRHRRFAEDVAERLTVLGMRATSSVIAGDPAHEIVAAANRFTADLIITGTRGLRGLERLVLGSVARNIVQHASCSVLVMRTNGTAHRAEERIGAGAHSSR